MNNKKFIAITLSMLIFLIGIVYIYKISGSEGVDFYSNEYVEKYFDRDKVMEINIEIDENELDDMFKNAQSEEFKSANITINGDTYRSVAIRPKGNSSLRAVASTSSADEEKNTEEDSSSKKGENRFSFKVNFDEYVSGQTMGGLTQLNLNNNYSDPSYMREFLAYSIFEDMGLKTPEMAYAKVSINGKYHGLYLAVESIQDPFLENNFESITGDLYKSTGAQGGALKYNGDDFKNYSSMVVKSDRKSADYSKFTDLLKALESGNELEKYLDVDSALKYIALNTAILNLDSYQGSFAHNYYLYEQNGKFTVVPWDLNMAFGGFSMGRGSSSDTLISIDEPTTGNIEDRPLVSTLLANEEYKEKYHEYLNEIVEKYLDSDYLENMTNKLYGLISQYVKDDPTAFYTFEEFEKNIKSEISDSSDSMNKGNRQDKNTDVKGNINNLESKNSNIQNEDTKNNVKMENGQMGKTIPGILDLSKTMSQTIKDQLSGSVSTVKQKNNNSEASTSEMPNMPEGMGGQNMPDKMDMQNMPEGMDRPNMPEGMNGQNMPDKMDKQNMPEGINRPNMPDKIDAKDNPPNIKNEKGIQNSSKYIISVLAIAIISFVIVVLSLFKRRRVIKVK